MLTSSNFPPKKKKEEKIWEILFSLCLKFQAPTRTPAGSLKKMEDKDAEMRAEMKLGRLTSVGRLILYSDTRADDERSHWEVIDMVDFKHLPSYVSKDRSFTKAQRAQRAKILYKTGLEHTSRIFARVAGGKSINWQ